MEELQELLVQFAASDAGATLIAAAMASAGATVANIFLKNEGPNAPLWQRMGGMFLRALSGSVGENTVKNKEA